MHNSFDSPIVPSFLKRGCSQQFKQVGTSYRLDMERGAEDGGVIAVRGGVVVQVCQTSFTGVVKNDRRRAREFSQFLITSLLGYNLVVAETLVLLAQGHSQLVLLSSWHKRHMAPAFRNADRCRRDDIPTTGHAYTFSSH